MIGLVAIAAATAALPASTFKPAGKWTLDYQPALCLLTRQFTKEPAKATFGLRQAPADSQSEAILLFDDDADDRVRRGIVALKLPGAGKAVLSGSAVSTKVPGSRQRLLRFLVPHSTMTALAQEKSVTVEELGRPEMTFDLEGASGAIRALQTCEAEHIKAWGVDPSLMAAPAKPIGDVAALFAFPLQAAVNRQAGETTVRWKIDVSGRVSDCTVMQSSGHAALDTAACARIAKLGRYTPAVGKDGKPMPWVETRRIIWALG